jgi:HK97 family phage portal protein
MSLKDRIFGVRRERFGLKSAEIPLTRAYLSQWSPIEWADTRWDNIVTQGINANSAVFQCMSTLSFGYPEPPPVVLRDGDPDPNNPLQRLLTRPNPMMSHAELMVYTMTYRAAGGNCYLHKVRNKAGMVVELWPYSIAQMWPIPSRFNWVEDYGYYDKDGQVRTVPAADVIHLKWPFVDLLNPTKAMSPLMSVFREVNTDTEATRYLYALLKNDAVMRGVVQVPAGVPLGKTQADKLRAEMYMQHGGDNRGGIAILEQGASYQRVSLNLQELAFESLRRVPESRIAGAFRVPAILAGLYVGLEKSTYCLPADARVSTPNGPVDICLIRPGDTVWSVVDGRLESRSVVRSGMTGRKMLYEVKTKNRTLRASGNHPVLVRVPGSMTVGSNAERSAKTEWRRVDELRLGDRVVQPKGYPDQGGDELPDGSTATADFMQFCGAIVGDGTVDAAGVRVAMPPADRTQGDYVDRAQRLFTHSRYAYRAERVPVHIQEGERQFGFSSRAVSQQLVDLGLGGRALTKRIPGWVFGLRTDLRLAFLAGLVDTDGSIDKRGVLQFAFANKALTHDVRDLLISCGIQCTNVYYRQVDASALPQPGLHDTYDNWSFVASSAVQVAAIPFSDPLYRERVDANATRVRSDGFDAHRAGFAPELGFYTVTSLRELHVEDVYDIEVDEGHSFVADGIVVHNSNYKEARSQLTEDTFVPLWRSDGVELTQALAAEFDANPDRLVVTYDTGKVAALQENEDAKYTRVVAGYDAGLLMKNEARAIIGLPPVKDLKRDDPEGDVFKLETAPQPSIIDVTPQPPQLTDGAKARTVEIKARSTETLEQQLQRDLTALYGDIWSTVNA